MRIPECSSRNLDSTLLSRASTQEVAHHSACSGFLTDSLAARDVGYENDQSVAVDVGES